MNSIWEMNAWQVIKAGGPIMVPILLCSIFALAIFIEKLIYFSSIKTDTTLLKKKIFEFLKNNQIKEAVQYCENNPSPAARILKAGLLQYGHPREEIKEGMEDASLFEIPKLENRLNALATIAHISPLLGFLGTVVGMTSSFHAMQIRIASMNPVMPQDLAGGIFEALLTTIAGLMVTIPTYLAYNYFVHRANHFVLQMEQTATELVNLMCQVTHTQN